MRVSFIGSGNVATHLAVALHEKGCTIAQVWSRNYDHANLLASRVAARPLTDLRRLSPDADAYILSVTDDALYDLAVGDGVQSPPLRLPGRLVMHTSGATPMRVLRHVSSRHGVLWSPQTFVRDVPMDYSSLPFCIEGATPAVEEEIAALARLVSPHVYSTTLEQRQWLHLAAVFSSNFTCALYAVAQRLCQEQGVPFETLYPLILATAQKARQGDLRYQLTGPAARGDQRTLDIHRRLLAGDRGNSPVVESQESPTDLLSLYDRLTALIQQLLN